MIQVNTREFRANQSRLFDKAMEGEKVMIRRHNQLFVIVPVREEGLQLTPELERRIAEASNAHECL
ncbi:MAG: hypothetical protein LIP03_11250 [Bacteroidales bacterium]|nr:hypothetical protein [Bacteroidales bacterium]